MIEIKRLGDKIIGALFHRLHRALDGAVGRNHDDGRLTAAPAQILQHLEAAFNRHLDIEQNHSPARPPRRDLNNPDHRLR